MEIKTSVEIMKEANFNYMYPQASMEKCEKEDNRKWVSVEDIKKRLKEEHDYWMEENEPNTMTALHSIIKELGDKE